MARIRQTDKALFPIKNVQSVVEIFKNQLENNTEPDLALLSIIVGYIENNLTSNRNNAELEIYEPLETTSLPALEIDVVEGLYSKFYSIVKNSIDLSLYERKFATRDLVKRVSDVIWNSLTRSYYKDRAHLQSLYSYLTGNKLDCFGVAFAVVAGCQALGYRDVHLALSEDHAWCVFGPAGESAEVTWHGKGSEDKRGQPVAHSTSARSWLYVNNKPVVCTRAMEVAALVSAINPSLNATSDAYEVALVQQQLLWLIYDLGHLTGYPMALGNLGDLEEVCPSPGRPPCDRLFQEAITAARSTYGNQHVYPYTYQGGYFYRQRMYKQALSSWANASDVISQYNYSRDDEEIYKEFLEIATELIPYVMKAESAGNDNRRGDPPLLSDACAFADLVRFYDGVCLWEQGSATPVLHVGWAKSLVVCIAKFPPQVRSKVTILSSEEEADKQTKNDYSFNNNNYEEKKEQLIREIEANVEKSEQSTSNSRPTIEALTAACSEKILNPEYLLQGGGSPFVVQSEEESEETSQASTSQQAQTVYPSPETQTTAPVADSQPARPTVVLRSQKMRGLKDLLLSEKLNTQAISLQLTAQSQVVGKKHQVGDLDSRHARQASKRSRRE